ncbi:hypothetical protein BU16DRAFT_534172 [Lophium mytilinum]|uniref:Uncharacterized protein n=1 Tax=Lophium mytilinum TaxID=390894 RepID=A0A6A6RAS7_9PEZI|nr:hypothetical protein BU16DRAFT_534172 [Lophium mytilinum]
MPPMASISARRFQIRRNLATTDSYNPCAGIEFDPPRDSDELFDALKVAYPRRKTHKARMREAIIEFLVSEREASRSRSGSPVVSTRDSDRSKDIEYSVEGPDGPGASHKISQESATQSSRKESFVTITTPEPRPATTLPLADDILKSQTQMTHQRSITVHSSTSTKVAVNDLTIVWSSVDGLARKARVKRIMTDDELEQYRLRRVIGACKVCKSKKRKCIHGDQPPASPPDAEVRVSKRQKASTPNSLEASATGAEPKSASLSQTAATNVEPSENRRNECRENPRVNAQKTSPATSGNFDSNAWMLGAMDEFNEIDAAINALGYTKSPPPFQPAQVPALELRHPVVDPGYSETAIPIPIDDMNIPSAGEFQKPPQVHLQKTALADLPQFISPAELDLGSVSQTPDVNIEQPKSPSKLSNFSSRLLRKSGKAKSKADHVDRPRETHKMGYKEQSSAKMTLKQFFSPSRMNRLDDLYLTEPPPNPPSRYAMDDWQPHASELPVHEVSQRFPVYEMELAHELESTL